jgi:hypothetical protein
LAEAPALQQRARVTAILLLVVLSLFVTILFVEGASRLFYYLRWDGHLYNVQSNNYSLRLGWELAPGSYSGVHINSQGFRRPEDVSLRPAENTIRIFIVGGSTAFGTNGLYPQFEPKPLAYEDTLAYHLQTMLRARHQGTQFEVINAAVPEYRLFQEITLFREKLVNFKPHLVIFLDGHNDISFLTTAAGLKQSPAPYWESRHFARGQRVLNSSGFLGPFYYFDVYLGRASYFYHGLSELLQRLQNVSIGLGEAVPLTGGAWGDDIFRLSDEKLLIEKYRGQLEELDQGIPLYLDQVKDIRAIAFSREMKILYVLQPEILVEDPTHLTNKEFRIQEFAFRHHHDLGTLSYRYLAPKIASTLESLSDNQFQFLSLVTIGGSESDEVYTDYCHLTSKGNYLVAEKLYPRVVDLIGLDRERFH